MQVKDLELFVAIINEKSITKAAERLYMAQSTASRRIVEMESELGHPLLYRSTHGLTVTAQGKRFIFTRKRCWKNIPNCLKAWATLPFPAFQSDSIQSRENRAIFPPLFKKCFGKSPVSISI